MKTIFDRFTFFNDDKIELKLADILIIYRNEDCPLKSAIFVSENETDYEDFRTPNNLE